MCWLFVDKLTLTCGHAPLLLIEQHHQAWSLHMNMKYWSWHWSCSNFLRWIVRPWKLTFFLSTWASILWDKFQLEKVDKNANFAFSQIPWRYIKRLHVSHIHHSSKFQLCPQCCEILIEVSSLTLARIIEVCHLSQSFFGEKSH